MIVQALCCSALKAQVTVSGLLAQTAAGLEAKVTRSILSFTNVQLKPSAVSLRWSWELPSARATFGDLELRCLEVPLLYFQTTNLLPIIGCKGAWQSQRALHSCMYEAVGYDV